MEISQRQILLFTEDKLTSLPEDFLVNRIHLQENERAKKMRDTSGQRCLEQLERFNQVGSWAKTFLASLIGQEGWYSTRCRLTWKLRGTKYSRVYCQLAVSMLPIEERGSGLLPTITTQEIEHPTMKLTDTGRRIANNGSSHSLNLADTARMLPRGLMPTPQAMESPSKTEKMMELKEKGLPLMSRSMGDNSRQFNLKDWMMYYDLLPTPRACESIERRNMKTIVDKVENGGDVTLTTLAKYKEGMLLPTPATRDYKGGKSTETLQKRKDRGNFMETLPDKFAIGGKTSQLNPRFVAEMMGFPPDYLELPFLNIEMKA